MSKEILMQLTFNKNFYKIDAVNAAIHVYSKFADFELEKKQDKIKVVLYNIDSDVEDVIGDEFSNYVLAGMQELKKEY